MNLKDALERCLAQRFGIERSIVALHRAPGEYRSSFAIEDLDVYLDDSTNLPVVFKDLSRHALLDEARLVKPAFIHDPMREIRTYDQILSSNGLGTPDCYGFFADPEANCYWLFLEKVQGTVLEQVGELITWQEVARWLARMHCRLRIQSGSWRHCHPIRYDADFYWQWLSRAQEFCILPSAVRFLAGHYDRVVQHLLALPQTFIHGEFYPSNVLVRDSSNRSRVCALDWETASIGPALMDLAALTAGNWTEAERYQIMMAYRDAIEAEGEELEAVEPFLESVEYCRLHLCVQWLGWARTWSPPRNHAHDWLGEAMTLAERLCV